MTATELKTRVDILNLALNEAVIEKDSIEKEIEKMNEQESAHEGIQALSEVEREQLNRSRLYYAKELNKVNHIIYEIQLWKEELREETFEEKVG